MSELLFNVSHGVDMNLRAIIRERVRIPQSLRLRSLLTHIGLIVIGWCLACFGLWVLSGFRFSDGWKWSLVRIAFSGSMVAAAVILLISVVLSWGTDGTIMPPLAVPKETWICAACGRVTARRGNNCHNCGSGKLVSGR